MVPWAKSNMCACDDYVVLLFAWRLYVERDSLDGFCFGRESIKGWIAERLGVAWIIILYPLDGAGRIPFWLFPEAGGEVRGEGYEPGSLSMHILMYACVSAYQSASCWSPWKLAHMKLQDLVIPYSGSCVNVDGCQ